MESLKIYQIVCVCPFSFSFSMFRSSRHIIDNICVLFGSLDASNVNFLSPGKKHYEQRLQGVKRNSALVTSLTRVSLAKETTDNFLVLFLSKDKDGVDTAVN